MATAGTPESARPVSVRSTSRLVQPGTTAQATVSNPTAKSETVMIGLRPKTSETRPTTSMASASVPVVSDSERLAALGDTPRSAEKTGSSGCTQ